MIFTHLAMLPSGKRLHNSGKSQFLMGKSTITPVFDGSINDFNPADDL
jgi:hypothetical protein